MATPESKMTCVKNIWIRQMHFAKAGDMNEGHVHKYDHVTLLAKGSAKVHVNGKTTEFIAPNVIYIKAGSNHNIEAMEDGTVAYCVHAIRNSETQDILDPSQIPDGIDPQVLSIVDNF